MLQILFYLFKILDLNSNCALVDLKMVLNRSKKGASSFIHFIYISSACIKWCLPPPVTFIPPLSQCLLAWFTDFIQFLNSNVRKPKHYFLFQTNGTIEKKSSTTRNCCICRRRKVIENLVTDWKKSVSLSR